MRTIRVFERVFYRRLLWSGSILLVLSVLFFFLSPIFFGKPKTTQAFTNNENDLYVAADEMLYIGPGGYYSQRIWSDVGQPIDWSKRLAPRPSTGRPTPADFVYRYNLVEDIKGLLSQNPGGVGNCPPGFNNCKALIGDGSGMIVKYNNQIRIDGTVYITDRVVLDAPNIIIGSTARIIASGQDGSHGIGDRCGYGGIGGFLGGTAVKLFENNPSLPSHILSEINDSIGHMYCDTQDSARASTQVWVGFNNELFIKPINNKVLSFFQVNDQPIYGGMGREGSRSDLLTFDPGSSTQGVIGLGGGGGSGVRGSSVGTDHGASGGGGGGFGLVFKADNISVNDSATITAAGGNPGQYLNDWKIYPASFTSPPTGSFGGGGGGGVIIIDSNNVEFKKNVENCYWLPWPRSGRVCDIIGEETAPENYSLFNVEGGHIYVAGWHTSFPHNPGGKGSLIIKSQLGKDVAIKKSLRKVVGSGSPYSVQPGDVLEVTLDVGNLTPGQRVTIKDEMFNDAGVNFSIFRSCTDSCQPPSGNEISWNFDPTSSSKVLKYQIEIR